jgi:hypothetical protein
VAPECDVESSEFTGEIRWIQLKLGDDDHTHQLPADAHLSVLMGRQ